MYLKQLYSKGHVIIQYPCYTKQYKCVPMDNCMKNYHGLSAYTRKGEKGKIILSAQYAKKNHQVYS
jgi:hypothetical protein